MVHAAVHDVADENEKSPFVLPPGQRYLWWCIGGAGAGGGA